MVAEQFSVSIHEPSQIQNVPKLIRLVHTVFLMVDKTPTGPWDEPTRRRLATTWRGVIGELREAVIPEARDELDRLLPPLSDDTPTENELRIEQAQIAGWLDGLMLGEEVTAWADAVDEQRELVETFRTMRTTRSSPALDASPYM